MKKIMLSLMFFLFTVNTQANNTVILDDDLGLKAQAKSLALTMFGEEQCWDITNKDFEPTVYKVDVDGTKLVEVTCYLAAYNMGVVYFLSHVDGSMMPVGLPTPNYDVEYSDTEMETVKSVTVTTFSTSYIMVNSGYDPETKTLNSFEKWRGLGDASTEGEWSYDVTSKSFNLKKYLVDASYNGELDPEVVFSSKQK